MKDNSQRPPVPKEKIIVVKRATKKIDFGKPFKFIYFNWWFELLIRPFYLLCYALTALGAIYFSLRVSGRENLRVLRKQGCIVISNHCHFFDTVFVNFTLFPQRLYTSVVQRNFEVPYIRRILRFLRAFPIPAGRMGFKAIAGPVGEALRRGHHVLVLPEGDLCYLSQEIYQFKPGAFYMACYHQAPILPIVYVITRRLRNGVEQNRHHPRIRQVIGKLMYPPPMNPDKSFPKEALHDMMTQAAQWMEDTIVFYHAEDAARAR